jgi:acylphosphatase
MADNAPLASRFFIDGRVQGVGFRWFTKKAADALGLQGFVRNLPDGRVEAVAVGDESQLREFRLKINQGPSYSLVSSVVESRVSGETNFSSFEITY